MIQKPRGTEDLLKVKANIYDDVCNNLSVWAKLYGFEKIKTPIFESSDLFYQTVGVNSDIVQKEMYAFQDKKGRNLVLRPEGTAPIIRSFLENKMYGENNLEKLFYIGEMFRYERPQKGRQREFTQFGVEAIGSNNAYLDAEIIMLAANILKSFNINAKLIINFLGSSVTRAKYQVELEKHLKSIQNDLCDDCQRRISQNLLRVLDCKVDQHKLTNVPKIINYLTSDEKNKYNEILQILTDNEIEYTKNHLLVRGLDYYDEIIFEFIIDEKGSQNAILGGGRYNHLANKLGNVDAPAIGFAIGIERLIQAVMINNFDDHDYQKQTDIFFETTTHENTQLALKYMQDLRTMGLSCESTYNRQKSNAQYKLSQKLNAIYYIQIIDENKLIIKNLKDQTKVETSFSDFKKKILEDIV